MRFGVEYRRLNQSTMADTYRLRHMDYCIHNLGETSVFWTLHDNYSYWQIPVKALH